MPNRSRANSAHRPLIVLQFLGDSLSCFVALASAYWLRFESPLRLWGSELKTAGIAGFFTYLPLIYVGTILFVGTFGALQAYNPAYLLRPARSINIVIRAVFFWVVVYLGLSLVLKFEPAISRIFVAVAAGTTLALLAVWRFVFFQIVSKQQIRDRIAQSVLVLGWSHEAARLVDAIRSDRNHPYDFVGHISTSVDNHSVDRRQTLKPVSHFDGLDDYLTHNPASILVVADLDLTRDQLVRVASICERHYVAFKIIPSFFQIFISNLRLQTISGVSILGIESLPLDSIFNQLLKRAVDIVGALVGLFFSIPVMAVLGILIRRESPGPILFAQERVGIGGSTFRMIKLRSMVPDAHLKDHQSQSTLRRDPRMTKIGAFIRQWNLDELPQFWNVLKGDMSLVGPRPERTFHARQLSFEIPHYNTRHAVRPGLTGWAQVNGLRGDTSLVERIRYDLFYIENWSPWFDVQIMLFTFVRRKNAY